MLSRSLHEGRLQDLLDGEDGAVALAGRLARSDEFLHLMWHSYGPQIERVLGQLLYPTAELFRDFGEILQILLQQIMFWCSVRFFTNLTHSK